jgi:hypothetical protein
LVSTKREEELVWRGYYQLSHGTSSSPGGGSTQDGAMGFCASDIMRSSTSSAVNKCRGKKERKKLSKDANGPVL